ncbi:hypothetical protein KEM56_006155, partial [Ascosphaera pollenicola]
RRKARAALLHHLEHVRELAQHALLARNATPVRDARPLHPDEQVAVAAGPRGQALRETLQQCRGERGVDALDGCADDGGVGGMEAGFEEVGVVCFEGLREDVGEGDAGGGSGGGGGDGGEGFGGFGGFAV